MLAPVVSYGTLLWEPIAGSKVQGHSKLVSRLPLHRYHADSLGYRVAMSEEFVAPARPVHHVGMHSLP